MLRLWAEEMLRGQVFTVSDTCQRVDSLLEKMKSDANAAYRSVVDEYPNGQDLLALNRTLAGNSVKVRERLQLIKDRLDDATVMIEQMVGLLLEEGLDEHDIRRFSAKVRLAVQDIKDYRNEIISDTLGKIRELDQYRAAIKGFTARGSSGVMGSLHEWLNKVFRAAGEDIPEAEARVTVSRSGSTLQGRLRALGTGRLPLSGDSGDAKIHIRSENELYFHIFGENNTPLKGVGVTIWDESNPDRPSYSCTTDESGYAYFTAETFEADYDKSVKISLRVEAESVGYQSFYSSNIYAVRGEERNEYLTKLDGEAYIYSADFYGYDILRKEWSMLYAAANDFDFDIVVTVRDPKSAGYDQPVLHYEHYDGTDDPEEEEFDHITVSPTKAEGDVYTFTGPWKIRFTPEAENRPYFTFGKDGEKVIGTMIASVRSAVDKPTYSGEETTSPLNSLLSQGFGFKFSVPITDDITFSVGFELPVSNYWPKITASPSGVIVSFGSQMTDPSEKMPGNWKSADAKNYDNLLKEWENQEYLARKESEIGAAYDYYKSSYTNFVQKTQLALGWFGLFSARWQEDEDFDTWLCTVSGSTGLILTFSYDITYPFSIGPVPLYANLNIALSAGFCFGLNAEFAMMHGDFTNVRFTAFPALTIELAFAITFSLGIGIKGLISVYISGTACLNLAIAVITDAPPTVSPSFSAFVKVGVEMLFFSESLIIMMYPSSQTTGGGTLFSLFMSRALADDEP